MVDVSVRSLDPAVQQREIWGGPAPDAATALTRILARVFDGEGDVGPSRFLGGRPTPLGGSQGVVKLNVGGESPSWDPFRKSWEGAPGLLLGVEDPMCNAHGENESLCLADSKRALREAALLLHELAAV
jgi:hypothetical protein